MKKYGVMWVSILMASLIYLFSHQNALAQVFNGQAVNATVTNNAYWKRNVDDSASGVYSLSNVVVSSGSSVTNMQREFNACSSYTGLALNSVYNILPAWTNNDVGSSSNNLFQRSDAVTLKFNSSNGHKHTGAAGDAPQLTNSAISSSAAISRSKIAAGTVGDVVINDPITGLFSEEAQLSISRGGTGQATQTTAFDALSPLTTKGDTLAHNGTHNVRFAACSNGQSLQFDSTQTSGIKCVTVSAFTAADLTATSPISVTGGTGAVNGSGTSITLGTVGASNGGTGQTSLTANNVILGNGTSAVQFVAPGTSGNILTSNGSTWTSAAAGASTGLNAKFSLTDAIVPYVNIDGPHYQVGTLSLTAVYISMLNSGTAGSTVIQVNVYRSGSLNASATASLSASSGNPASSNASLSGTLSLLAGDVLTVDVNSVASGDPESLTVEY